MKLKGIHIEGFRGAPIAVDLDLAGKSLCLLAENGHGKTTFVDALELWSTGDVAHYHREGYGQDCLVHVDASSAVLECEVIGLPPLRRTLSGSSVSELVPTGPLPADQGLPPELPILRHRTLADFMNHTPGEKKDALLRLAGLAALTGFREEAKSAANQAKRDADQARKRVAEEVAALEKLSGGIDHVGRAATLVTEAGLGATVKDERDIIGLQLETAPPRATPDRLALVTALGPALADAHKDNPTQEWNDAVSNRRLLAEEALSSLLSAGDAALEHWDEDSCPLCLQDIDRQKLREDIRRRAQALKEADAKLARLKATLAGYADRLDRAQKAIAAVLAARPLAGWSGESELEAARQALETHQDEVRTARRESKTCPPMPKISFPTLEALKAEALAEAARDRPQRAVANLVQLRDQLQRRERATEVATRAEAAAQAAAAFVEIVDRHVRSAMETAIATVASKVAEYYARLLMLPYYSDVAFDYTPGRAGGVEFSLTFDGRHPVTPPQRIMSESQLNALGLALFLARLRVEPQAWRTIVLDDVVNSFDGDHRASLAQLLQEEFSDWQVLAFTHDRVFEGMLRRGPGGWRFTTIVAWTPTGGPVIESGSLLDLLETRLKAGRSAIELGGLARQTLERSLSFPLEKLELSVRFDPLGRHSAMDYLGALRGGLRKRKASFAADPVFDTIERASYITNLGAHDRLVDPALSTTDLRQLVANVKTLEDVFVCTTCTKPVWTNRRGNGQFGCQCGSLTV